MGARCCMYTKGCALAPAPGRRMCQPHLDYQNAAQRKSYAKRPDEYRRRNRNWYRENRPTPTKHVVHCRRCGKEGHFAKGCDEQREVTHGAL